MKRTSSPLGLQGGAQILGRPSSLASQIVIGGLDGRSQKERNHMEYSKPQFAPLGSSIETIQGQAQISAETQKPCTLYQDENTNIAYLHQACTPGAYEADE